MRVTAEMLHDKRACLRDLRIFVRQWPAGAEITRENVRLADRLDLDLSWFVYAFLHVSVADAYFEALDIAYREYSADAITAEDYDAMRVDAFLEAVAADARLRADTSNPAEGADTSNSGE